MSRVFGALRQLGYVVRDIDAAMAYWVEINGVGPWFYIERLPLSQFEYLGQPSDPDVAIALSFSGSAQVELIQQRNDAPSMYRDYIKAGQEGLQHVAYWPEDYDGAMQRAEARGLKVGQQGDIAGRGRFVYYQTVGHHGTCVEFAEYNAYRKHQFAEMERICNAWDGGEPVRTQLPAPPN